MKTLAPAARWLVAVLSAFLAAAAARAQVPSAGSPAGLNSAFLKLFGTASAFSARVETQVLNSWQTETVRLPMNLSTLDGKARMEINLAEIKSKDMPPSTVEQWKQAGRDRVVSVFRPDKKLTYVLYPAVQSYETLPLAAGEAEAAAKGFKLEKDPVGKETIDGHACTKNKVVVKGDKGAVLEAVTWNAPDLKDFPVQIEMKEKLNTVRMRFSQVRFERPDASLFEVPAKYGRVK